MPDENDEDGDDDNEDDDSDDDYDDDEDEYDDDGNDGDDEYSYRMKVFPQTLHERVCQNASQKTLQFHS